MIDLHCHILPGVDDGAPSMAVALEMARCAWNSGVRAIVATPHCGKPGADENFFSQRLRMDFRRLQTAIAGSGCGLKIYPGMEIFVTKDFPQQLQEGKLLTLGGSDYLLVEFYFDESPEFIGQTLQLIGGYGLRPMIAHPERYDCIQWQPELAMRWADAGAALQLNRGSIQGKLGQAAQKCTWTLLKSGKVHVVASDGHGSRIRRPELKSVFFELGEKLSWSYASRLLIENPRKVLENQLLQGDAPLPRTVVDMEWKTDDKTR